MKTQQISPARPDGPAQGDALARLTDLHAQATLQVQRSAEAQIEAKRPRKSEPAATQENFGIPFLRDAQRCAEAAQQLKLSCAHLPPELWDALQQGTFCVTATGKPLLTLPCSGADTWNPLQAPRAVLHATWRIPVRLMQSVRPPAGARPPTRRRSRKTPGVPGLDVQVVSHLHHLTLAGPRLPDGGDLRRAGVREVPGTLADWCRIPTREFLLDRRQLGLDRAALAIPLILLGLLVVTWTSAFTHLGSEIVLPLPLRLNPNDPDTLNLLGGALVVTATCLTFALVFGMVAWLAGRVSTGRIAQDAADLSRLVRQHVLDQERLPADRTATPLPATPAPPDTETSGDPGLPHHF